MIIRTRIVPDATGHALRKGAAAAAAGVPVVVTRGVAQGTANIAERTPVGHSGALRGGWSWRVRRRGRSTIGEIINPILYTDVRDQGRRPGRRPPTSALVPWVGSKLGIPPGPERDAVAFLVARKIGRSGYEGARMIDSGWEATLPAIEADLAKLGLRIVRTIDTA